MKALITRKKDLDDIVLKVILNAVPFLAETFHNGNIVMENCTGDYVRPYVSKTIEKKSFFKTIYKYEYVPIEELLCDILFAQGKKYNLTPGKRLKVFIRLLEVARNSKERNLEYILEDFELETLNMLYEFSNNNSEITIDKRWN